MDREWTDEQAAAISSQGDLLISASAGTGKTTTIVGKIVWSLGLQVGRVRGRTEPIASCPHPLDLGQIAAITFTEKAAHDLQEKLRDALQRAPEGSSLRRALERATVGTIHGFAADLLREHALRLDVDPTFRILDPRESDLQQTEIVRGVLATALRERDAGAVELTKRYGLRGWKMAPGAVDRIRDVMRDLRWRAHEFEAWSVASEGSRYTRTLDLPGLRERARFAGAWSSDPVEQGRDDLALLLSDTLYRLGRSSVHGWLSWLERENARDFDSLILDARRLLTRPQTRSALEAIRRRYRLLIIDEFQDTDRAQWEIAKAIAGDADDPEDSGEGEPGIERPQLILVGDPKQSIYRFRGADIDVWNEARDRIARTGDVLELSWNFRSQPGLVEYVNQVGTHALSRTAAALEETSPGSVVRYQPLRGARPPTAAAGLEWIAVDEKRAADQREEEGRRVAGRLHELIGHAAVTGSSGSTRPCRAGDIAILARRNDDLVGLETALRNTGIPFYNAATAGLSNRQEILDLVTALRVIDNPLDDLRAFAFLRSPFVGLRDEVLARITLDGCAPGRPPDGGRSLLDRAESVLAAGEADESAWFSAPEHPSIAEIERHALHRGLEAIRSAQALANRAGHAQLLESVLERTGYRLHLLLREGAPEALSNIERFLALLEEYRHLSLVHLLALWDRWGADELRVPQARLSASGDDVVTLSTIHAAKGLEWPVVVLVGTGAPLADARRFVGSHWDDPALGPVFLPKRADRGPRAAAALERRLRQEHAEAARLLYVAATRARDRLLVAGPLEDAEESFAGWLGVGLADAREAHEAVSTEPESRANGRAGAQQAQASDAATGTGRQIDAFGFEPRPQLDLFSAERDLSDGVPGGGPAMIVRRHAASVQTSMAPPAISLAWIEDIQDSEWPPSVGAIAEPRSRSIGSATERMLFETDRDAWTLRYRHGVLPEPDFLGPAGGAKLPARARGTLIHGVLERIREEEEIGRVLEETIASLDLGDLEMTLASGSRYRIALEGEISRVVASPQWRWYVEGIHHRELRFLYRSPNGWVQGAFDILRPADVHSPSKVQPSLFGSPADDAGRSFPAPWIIDFKTHRIDADGAREVAGHYDTQARTYRDAVAALLGGADGAESGVGPRVGLHFTYPNVVVEMPVDSGDGVTDAPLQPS